MLNRCNKKPLSESVSVLVAIVFYLISLPLLAADPRDEKAATYFGADIVYNNLSLEASDSTFNPITARLRLGVNIFPDLIPSLGFESHFALDISDDEQVVNGQNVTIKLDHQFSLFAKPYYELSEDVTVYGLVGFAAVQLQGDTSNSVVSDDTDTSFSIGAGSEFALPVFDINGRVEVMQLITGEDFDLFTVSFGISVPL